MFIREKTVQGRTYLQVVENYREGAKLRQRVIATLGRKEELSASGQIEGVLKSLSRFSDRVRVTEDFREGKLEAKKAVKIGPDLVCARLWSELGCDAAIAKLLSGRKYAFSVERAVYAAVLARLFFPGSDRFAERQARDFRISEAEGISLHHLYRAMAWPGENREGMEEELFFRNRDLFCSLSVVFFCTTSLCFEGRGGEALGQRGYPKDRRPDENRMVVGVVMDGAERPISCPMWPGNTADAATILPVAAALRERFGVSDICIVADRGMVGAQNAKKLTDMGFPYILGAGMRLEKRAMAEALSRAGRYREVSGNLKVKEVAHEGKRYVVCVNPSEAVHDRAAREAIVSDLQEKLKRGASSLIGNSGYRRYLQLGQKPEIDWERVKTEECYDGRWVLTTTADLSAEEVALKYKELWRVERVFREAKDTLATRPIYHKYDSTISGHVFCSFLALLIMHELKRRVDFPCEWRQLKQDLEAVYEIEVADGGKRWLLRSPLEGVAGKVFKAAGVAVPPSARMAQL
ncbi:MAG: transposase [Actinobacteria bacterium]|nr:transposase [Actinomycetota bacterium]